MCFVVAVEVGILITVTGRSGAGRRTDKKSVACFVVVTGDWLFPEHVLAVRDFH